jgi:hypothetical protein
MMSTLVKSSGKLIRSCMDYFKTSGLMIVTEFI